MSDYRLAIPARDGLIRVEGADATAFLQGQLSNDVAAVSETRGQPSSLNSPKGRVLAVLRVSRDTDGYWLAMPHSVISDVLPRLKRYVLRSRVSLDDATLGFKHLGLWGTGAEHRLQRLGLAAAAEDWATVRSHAGMAMRLPGAEPRFELWVPATQFAAFFREYFEDCEPLGLDAWTRREIAAGFPNIFPATQERFVAQTLGLDALGAINYRKGCYTGQEVIARSHYLGKLKRALYRLTLERGEVPAPGTEILDAEGASAGRLVAAAADDAGVAALAVLKTPPPDGLRVADLAIRHAEPAHPEGD